MLKILYQLDIFKLKSHDLDIEDYIKEIFPLIKQRKIGG